VSSGIYVTLTSELHGGVLLCHLDTDCVSCRQLLSLWVHFPNLMLGWYLQLATGIIMQ
jgi:hypothetical protein